jgi:hypothetical protein
MCRYRLYGHAYVCLIGYRVVLSCARGYDVDCVLGVDQG